MALSNSTTRNVTALDRLLGERRPLVMGILNVTPDSFSDGGRFVDPQAALAHARQMIADGADLIDVGAESTRPYVGAEPVSFDDEIARLAPVLRPVTELGTPVSVDTMKAKVAAWALQQGVAILNDVWGLQRDPDMARVAAEHDVPVVVMHNREQAEPALDIMRDIEAFFLRSLDIASKAGIASGRIVLDPGIGFGKTPEQSIEVVARLAQLKRFGLPVLVGLSRKRFINVLSPSKPEQRIGGSLAGNVMAVLEGADIVRVHDVAQTTQAMRVMAAIRRARHG
jgi:dihydropteroate synthase